MRQQSTESHTGNGYLTPGAEATHSGAFLESILEMELKVRGFLFRLHSDAGENLDLFAPRIVLKRVPYTNLYGCQSISEFVITDHMRRVRAECRWQESSGSVDEKFPYLLQNMVECAPENEALILYGGGGARPQAVAWLKRAAAKVQNKKIYVVNLDEFRGWVKREFVR